MPDRDNASAFSSRLNIGPISHGTCSLMLRLLLLTCLPSAALAYWQDKPLESALRRSDPQALALLPAKGYKNGAAGFFRDYDLIVVRDTERAWCNDKPFGVLPPGCYIEFQFQLKGHNPKTSDGIPCGIMGRWLKAPGSKTYKPTPGAYYSLAIANGKQDELIMAFDERTPPRNFKDLRRTSECDSAEAAQTNQQASR